MSAKAKKEDGKDRLTQLMKRQTRTHQTKAHELEDVTESPPPAAKPKKERKTVRYTIDLTPEHQRMLKQFTLDAGVFSSAKVIRSLIEKLGTDAELRAKLLAELAVQED